MSRRRERAINHERVITPPVSIRGIDRQILAAARKRIEAEKHQNEDSERGIRATILLHESNAIAGALEDVVPRSDGMSYFDLIKQKAAEERSRPQGDS